MSLIKYTQFSAACGLARFNLQLLFLTSSFIKFSYFSFKFWSLGALISYKMTLSKYNWRDEIIFSNTYLYIVIAGCRTRMTDPSHLGRCSLSWISSCLEFSLPLGLLQFFSSLPFPSSHWNTSWQNMQPHHGIRK